MAWNDWEAFRARISEDTPYLARTTSYQGMWRYQYSCQTLSTTTVDSQPSFWPGNLDFGTDYMSRIRFGSRVTLTIPAEVVNYHIDTVGPSLQWSFQADAQILHTSPASGIAGQGVWTIHDTGTIATFSPISIQHWDTYHSHYWIASECFVSHSGATQSTGFGPLEYWRSCPAHWIGSIDPTNPATFSWYGTLATANIGGKFIWPRQTVTLTRDLPVVIDYYVESDEWLFYPDNPEELIRRCSLWTDLATSTAGTLTKTQIQSEVSLFSPFNGLDLSLAKNTLPFPLGDPYSFEDDVWGETEVTTSLKRGVLLQGSLDHNTISIVGPQTMSLEGTTGYWYGWDDAAEGCDFIKSFDSLAVRSRYIIPVGALTGATGPALFMPVLHVWGTNHASPCTFDYRVDGSQDCKGWIQVSQGSLSTVVRRFDSSNDLVVAYGDPIARSINGSLTQAAISPLSLDYTQPIVVETRLTVGKPRQSEDVGVPLRLGFVLGLDGGAVASATRQSSFFTLSGTDGLYQEPFIPDIDFNPIVLGVSAGSPYGYSDESCWATPLRKITGRRLCGEALAYPFESYQEDSYGPWARQTSWILPYGAEAGKVRIEFMANTTCTNPDFSGFSYLIGPGIQTSDEYIYSGIRPTTQLGSYTGVFGPTTAFTVLTIESGTAPWAPFNTYDSFGYSFSTIFVQSCPSESILAPYARVTFLPKESPPADVDSPVRAGSITRKFITAFGNGTGEEWAVLDNLPILNYITDRALPLDATRNVVSTIQEKWDPGLAREYRADDASLRFYQFSVSDGLVAEDPDRTLGFVGATVASVVAQLTDLSEPFDSRVVLLLDPQESLVPQAAALQSLGTVIVITTGDRRIADALANDPSLVLTISDWADPSITAWLTHRIPGYDIFEFTEVYGYTCGECQPVDCYYGYSVPKWYHLLNDVSYWGVLLSGRCVLNGTLTDGRNPIVGGVVQADSLSSWLPPILSSPTDAAGSFTICLSPTEVHRQLTWCGSPWHFESNGNLTSGVCPPTDIELVSRPWIGSLAATTLATYSNLNGTELGIHRERWGGDYNKLAVNSWLYWCDQMVPQAQVVQATIHITPVSLATVGRYYLETVSQNRSYMLNTFAGDLPPEGVSIPFDIRGRFAEEDHCPFAIQTQETVVDWDRLPYHPAVTGLTAYPNQDLPEDAATFYVWDAGIYEISPGCSRTESGTWFQARAVIPQSLDCFLVYSNTIPSSGMTVTRVLRDLNIDIVFPLDHDYFRTAMFMNLEDDSRRLIPLVPYWENFQGHPASILKFAGAMDEVKRCFLVTYYPAPIEVDVSVEMACFEHVCDDEVLTETIPTENWLYQYGESPMSRFTLATLGGTTVDLQVTTFERDISLADDTKWIDFGWIDPSAGAPASWDAQALGYYSPHILGVRTRTESMAQLAWFGACTPSTLVCLTATTVSVNLPIGSTLATIDSSGMLPRIPYQIAVGDPQPGEDGLIWAIENPSVSHAVSHYCWRAGSALGPTTSLPMQVQLECAEPFETVSAWGYVTARTRYGTTTIATFDFMVGESLPVWSPVVEPSLATWPYPFPLAKGVYSGTSYVLGFPTRNIAVAGDAQIDAWIFQTCGATVSFKINPGTRLTAPEEFLYEGFNLASELCCATFPTSMELTWLGGSCTGELLGTSHTVTDRMGISVSEGYAHVRLRGFTESPLTVTPVISAAGGENVRLYNAAAWIVQSGSTLATFLAQSSLASAALVSGGTLGTLPDIVLNGLVDLDLYVARPCAPPIDGYQWELNLDLYSGLSLFECRDTWTLNCEIGELSSVTANPTSLILEQLGTASLTATPDFLSCGVTLVTYSLMDLPSGVVSTPVGSTTAALLSLAADVTAVTGLYTVSLLAEADSTITQDISLRIVRPGGDWGLSVTPSLLTIQPGLFGIAEVIEHLYNYDGTITLSTSNPAGIVSSLSGNFLTVNVGAASPGLHTVTVIGQSRGETRTAELGVYVPDAGFFLNLSPPVLQMEVGDVGVGIVEAQRYGGFTQDITLSSTGHPLTINPSVLGQSAYFEASALTAGTYTAEIVGTAGLLSQATLLTIEVFPVGTFSYFELVPEISLVTIAPTGTAFDLIAIQRHQLSGLADLSIAPESGFTFTFSSNPAGSSSLLQITSLSASPGLHTIGILGTIGSRSDIATITLYVDESLTDFTLQVSPDRVWCAQTGLATAEVTLLPLAGFSSSVPLTISGLPGGVVATFSPSDIATMSTLSLVATGAAIGSYPLVISGNGREAYLDLDIVADVPLFSLRCDGLIELGGELPIDVTLHQIPMDGFSFELLNAPSGLTSSFSPSSSRRSTTLSVGGTPAAGVYSMTIRGHWEDQTADCPVTLLVPDETLRPDFHLTPYPRALVLEPGWSGYVDVELTGRDGWSNSVAFSSSGRVSTPSSATGTRAWFDATVEGNHLLTVTASRGGISRSTYIPVQVLPAGSAPNFIPYTDPPLLIEGVYSTNYLQSLAHRVNGFAGTVDLVSLSGPASVSLSNVGGDIGVVMEDVVPGLCTVQAVYESEGLSRILSVPVQVLGSPDDPFFSLAVPATRVARSGSVSSPIEILPHGGFSSTPTLTLGTLPFGIGVEVVGSQLNFTASGGVEGTYDVTLHGAYGTKTARTTFPLVISDASSDFLLQPVYPTVYCRPGDLIEGRDVSLELPINVVSYGGFAGTLSLTQVEIPFTGTAALSSSFATTLVTLSLYVDETAEAGTYQVVTQGTHQGRTRYAYTTLVVLPSDASTFRLLPSSGVLEVGSSPASLEASVIPLGGFAGTVSFALTGLPSGCTSSISPIRSQTGTDVTIWPGGAFSLYPVQVSGYHTASPSTRYTAPFSLLLVDDSPLQSFITSLSSPLVGRAGEVLTSDWDVTHLNGDASSISFDANGYVAGIGIISATPSLQISLASDLGPGAYSLQLSAGNGISTQSWIAEVLVLGGPPKRYGLQANPEASFCWPTSQIVLTLATVDFASYLGPATISWTLPTGLQGVWSGEHLTVTALSTATPGLYAIETAVETWVGSFGTQVPLVVLPESLIPTFQLKLSPSILTMDTPGLGTYTVDQYFFNGFNTPASVSAVSLPTGVEVAYGPWVGDGVTSVQVSSTREVGGWYPYKVLATASTQERLSSAGLYLNLLPSDFYLEATPSSLSLLPGELGTVLVQAIPVGMFDDEVSLSLTSIHPYLEASLEGSTLTVRARPDAEAGQVSIELLGTSPSLMHSLLFPVDIGLAASRFEIELPDQSMIQCGEYDFPVYIHRYSGHTGGVYLELESEGVFARFDENPVYGDSTTLHIQSRYVAASPYTVTVTGTCEGLSASDTATYLVGKGNTFWVNVNDGVYNGFVRGVEGALVTIAWGDEVSIGYTDPEGWVPFCGYLGVAPRIAWSTPWHYGLVRESELPLFATVVTLPDVTYVSGRPHVWAQGLLFQDEWKEMTIYDPVPEVRPANAWPTFTYNLYQPSGQVLAATLHVVAHEPERFAEMGRDAARLEIWPKDMGESVKEFTAITNPNLLNSNRWRINLGTVATLSVTSLTFSLDVTEFLKGSLSGTRVAFEVGAWFPIQDPNFLHDQVKALLFSNTHNHREGFNSSNSFNEWDPDSQTYGYAQHAGVDVNFYSKNVDRLRSGLYPGGFINDRRIQEGTYGAVPATMPQVYGYRPYADGELNDIEPFFYQVDNPLGNTPWGGYCGVPLTPVTLTPVEGDEAGRYIAWKKYHTEKFSNGCFPAYIDYETYGRPWLVEVDVDQWTFTWSRFRVNEVRPGYRYFFVQSLPGGGENYAPWPAVIPTAADVYLNLAGMTTVTVATLSREIECLSDPSVPCKALYDYPGLQLHNMLAWENCEYTGVYSQGTPSPCGPTDSIPTGDFSWESLQSGYVRYGPYPDAVIPHSDHLLTSGERWTGDWAIQELTDYVRDGAEFLARANDPKNRSAGANRYPANWNWWISEARWVTIGPQTLPVKCWIEVEYHYWPCHYPLPVVEGAWTNNTLLGGEMLYTQGDPLSSLSIAWPLPNSIMSQVEGGTLHVSPLDPYEGSLTVWAPDGVDPLYSGVLPADGLDIDLGQFSGSYLLSPATLEFMVISTRPASSPVELPYYTYQSGLTDVTLAGRYELCAGESGSDTVGQVAFSKSFFLTDADESYLIQVGALSNADVYYDTTLLSVGDNVIVPTTGSHTVRVVVTGVGWTVEPIVWVTNGAVELPLQATIDLSWVSTQDPVDDTVAYHYTDEEWHYYQALVPLAGLEVERIGSEAMIEILDEDSNSWVDLHHVDNRMDFREMIWDSQWDNNGLGHEYYAITTRAIRWRRDATQTRIVWLGSCTEPTIDPDVEELKYRPASVPPTATTGRGTSEPVYRTAIPRGVGGALSLANHDLAAALMGSGGVPITTRFPMTDDALLAVTRQVDVMINLARGQRMMGNDSIADRILKNASEALQALGLPGLDPQRSTSSILSDTNIYGQSGISSDISVEAGIQNAQPPSQNPISSAVIAAGELAGLDEPFLPSSKYRKSEEEGAGLQVERMGEQGPDKKGTESGNVLNRMWNFMMRITNTRTSLRVQDQLGGPAPPASTPTKHTGKADIDSLPSMRGQIMQRGTWRSAKPLKKGEKALQSVEPLAGLTAPDSLDGATNVVDQGSRGMGPAMGLMRPLLPQTDEMRRMRSMIDGPLRVQIHLASAPVDMDVLNQELKRRL